jgi:hypothetical protein
MSESIHVFVYDPAGAGAEVAHEKVRDAIVAGTLFDVDGVGRALMLAGASAVRGEVRRVRMDALADLDARARVREGLFRRVGVEVDDTACWTWVAGPALAPRLAPARRSRGAAGGA